MMDADKPIPYPSQTAYQDALQNPALCFTVPELRSLVPLDRSPYGLPAPITGRFANVYRMGAPDGTAWGVKLFLRPLPGRARQYNALAAHRETLSPTPDWWTPFTFHENGIRIGAATFPVVQTPWLTDAVPLNAFVDAAIVVPNAVRNLQKSWRELLAAMESARFAHGDLQHGNIFVSGDASAPKLHLIDFDGAWVPALSGVGAEAGHPAYQHPRRTAGDWGLSVDRFAGIAVDAALTILTEAPELWYRFDNGDNVLWRREDFVETRSPGRALHELTRHNNARVRRVAERLRDVCESPVSLVPDAERFARLTD